MGTHSKKKSRLIWLKSGVIGMVLAFAFTLFTTTSDKVEISNPQAQIQTNPIVVPKDTVQIVKVNQVNTIVQADKPVTLAKVYEAAKKVDPQYTEILITEYFKVYPLKATTDLKCKEGYEPRDALVVNPDGSVTAQPLCYKKEAETKEVVKPSSFTSSVNVKNYREDAADRGWVGGWPKGITTLTSIKTERSGASFILDRRIAALAKLLLDETEKRGYMINPRDISGYVNRPIAGTRVASNHSWGLALDINVSRNPQTQYLKTDMPEWMPKLWNAYGFAWGGNYGSGTLKDAMHYEFMGTPSDATELATKAQNDFNPPAPVTVTEPGLLEPINDVLDGVGDLLGNNAN